MEAESRVSGRVRRPRVVVHLRPARRGRRPAARARGTAERAAPRAPGLDRAQLERLAPRLVLRERDRGGGRREARTLLTPACDARGCAGSASVTRASPIADQRTRWGSCSRGDALVQLAPRARAARGARLRRRARALPPASSRDHSRAVLAARRGARPGYRERAALARDHGQELLAYTPASPLTGGRPQLVLPARGPLGDVRLLRHADRLERRASAASSQRLFGDEDADALLARYHELEPEIEARAVPDATARCSTLTRDRLADEAARRPEGERGRARAVAARLGPFPEVPAALEELRARGWRLAHPLEHRPRPHRRVAGADRRPLRPLDRRRGRSARTSRRTGTGRLLRADRRGPRAACPRRREPLPRHRARERARPCERLDQPPRRGRACAAGRRASCPTSTGLAGRRSTSWCAVNVRAARAPRS